MRVIHDSDTVEFVDDVGDKLILRVCPTQRQVDRCEEIARKDAFEQLERMKATGIDPLAIAEKATDEEKAAARQAARNEPKSAAVRRERLKSLAVALVINGERIGGNAVIDAYDGMDPASAGWVDGRVAEVWDSALPSEADTQGPAADAGVPAGASDVAAL